MMLVACLPLLDRCGPNFMTRPTPFTAHPKFTSPSRLCNTLFADLCNSSRNPPRFGGSAAFLFTPFEISIEASTFRISGEATTSGTFGCKPKSCCNWPLNWRCGTPKAFEATGGSHKMCISAEPWPKKTKRKQKWEGKKHPKKNTGEKATSCSFAGTHCEEQTKLGDLSTGVAFVLGRDQHGAPSNLALHKTPQS